ncbi:hypothetical protein [Parabacteroides timonensis]|uniref:hypothetical protein n=1 Tax=Parabacteroides timonensis TaxID=1871013 RepID=UPI00094F3649|nr:hypothetical protein [Parabacteroides timonensis]
MATPSNLSGLLRHTYETSSPRLDNFPALESNWRELLPRLAEANSDTRYRNDDGKEGTLVSLWENHVLTVLLDIARQDISPDTGDRQSETGKWIARLNRYIDRNWKTINNASSSILIARQLKDGLEKSRTLNTIRSIREHFDYYLAQIENDGNMDGALSLLLAYLRNYGGITQTFNHRFATLPALYLRDILHAVPQGAIQDNAYIVVNPAENTAGFTLPAQQAFPAGQNTAGEDRLYQTVRNEYITPMQCAEANAVYIERKNRIATSIRKQAIYNPDISSAEKLFSDKHSKVLPLGWMIESSMLILGEGERKVHVDFRITAGTVSNLLPGIPDKSFILQFSNAEGWTEQSCTCKIKMEDNHHWLCFEITIPGDGILPAPCTEDTHGMTTEYPSLRILASETPCPYDWATKLKFDAVKIETNVSAIHNFTFYNELGQVDTSQPFQPFGLQSEKGAWFLFGNEEMGLKPLKEVRLKGKWKKLPETETEFNKLYKNYTAAAGQVIDINSFTISTEWQQGGKWKSCQGIRQHLFTPDPTDTSGEKADRSLSDALVIFDLTEKKLLTRSESVPYEYRRDRDGFFRATLQAPSIGFGTDAYRTLFTETMIHNSRCKKKDFKELPPEPVVPQLADVELSYIASEETTLTDIANSSIRLSRITVLSEQEVFPVNNASEQTFLPAFAADNQLYFAFLRAKGEQTVRMYLDMVLPKENRPFNSPQPGKVTKLAWEFWNGNVWSPIATDTIRAEETQGLTQSGFIEIRLPEKIKDSHTDKQGRAWLRAAVTGDLSSCLAIRHIRTNYIRLTAQNGDGSPLPAETIQGTIEPDERIESIFQPLPGFGGRPAETNTDTAIRQSSRISNRHRAITIKDYERLVLENFPEVDKVQCIPVPQEIGASEISLVIFSRTEDSRYYLSSAWKLEEIQQVIRQYTPTFIPLRVINPVYEQVVVHCKAILWNTVQDEGKAVRQLVVLAQNYLAPWYRKGEIPALRQCFSYKELHARMANHEDLMKLVALEVGGKSLPHVDVKTEDIIIQGKYLWSILLPKIEIELLSPHAGINEAEIEGNFIIT